MKVLFAVSNDNITTSVVNKFQQKYKEIVTTKSVYYFNAIVNELKRDKEYNAIVIEEDLEPISNNNYEKIDKFLLEKLDNISDEASRPTGEDIPIILICSDRRTKSDQLLRQLFSMSIYNALVGNDRSLDKVCDLMKKPRNKKDAKQYYEIETDQAEYEPHKDEIVSEEQIQSILNYYKKIGTNEKKCVQAFDRISKQYDNTQLRIIVKFLPIDVKAILEAYSPVYQKLMSNGTVLSNGKYNEYKPNNPKKPQKLDFISKDVSEQATNLSKPVVIPSNMNTGAKNENENIQQIKEQNKMNSNYQSIQQPMPQQNYNHQQMPQQNLNQQPIQQSNYGYQPIQQQNYNYQQPQYNNMMGGQPYNPYGGQPYNPYASQMPYGNMNNQSPYYNPQNNMQQPYNPYANNNQMQMNNANIYQNNLANNIKNTYAQNNEMTNNENVQTQNNVTNNNENTQTQNNVANNNENVQTQNNVANNNENVQTQNNITNNNGNVQAQNNRIENQNNSISENIEPKEPIDKIVQNNYENANINEVSEIPDIMNEIAPLTPMKPIQDEEESVEQPKVEEKTEETDYIQVPEIENNSENNIEATEPAVVEPIPVKRRRGRPRKIKPEEASNTETQIIDSTSDENLETPVQAPVKRRRGRPRKIKPEEEMVSTKKEVSNLPTKQEEKSILVQQDLQTNKAPMQINKESIQNNDVLIKNITEPVKEENNSNSDINLYDLDINDIDNSTQPEEFNGANIEDSTQLGEFNNETKIPVQQMGEPQLFNANINNAPNNIESISQNNNFMNIDEDAPYQPLMTEQVESNPYISQPNQNQFQQNSMTNMSNNTNSIQNTNMVGNGKIVAFVGTSKNGTSFIVNNVAQLLAENGVNTAVVDLTQNKNSYYFFTDNDANKIKTATESLKQLSLGQVNGLVVKNNLTIFTALPDDTTLQQINNENVISSLSNRFEVILLDCDYKTDYSYFASANEIYLVQSMDAFTIQPLTKFLSELKAKNILDENKLKIVINKYIKLRKLNAKMVVGGMSKYNEPSMTLQRDLFDPKKVQTITIPFDDQTYIRYLEAIAMCELTLNGYSKDVLQSLEKLKDMVYPLIAGANPMPMNNINYNGGFDMNNNLGYPSQISSQNFSNNMNETLNRMRNNNY